MKIGEIIGEPMLIHKIYDKKNIRIKTEELMETVGLNSDFTNRYPHEFS
ncbi:MAG TPA: peptide ABC transporter substrate-binding protein, partial [Deltaproteobacteria bacterium]|nr:peptide ABC transporter substrate-binding protein [Deltaproteobacteria bacterium]